AIAAVGSLAAPALIATAFITTRPQLGQPLITIPQAPALTTPAFTTAGPQLGSPFLVQASVLIAPAFTTARPQLDFPFIVRLATTALLAPPVVAAGRPILGAPECDELGPPLVWLHHRLKRWSNDPAAEFYDEDGTENEGAVQKAIFANLNDDIELSVSPGMLVGRSASEWGPAESIQPVYPLVLQDHRLQIDALLAWIEQLEARIAALESKVP